MALKRSPNVRWSAVVPTLGAATLDAALTALAAQNPPPRLVVVLQGSIDDSLAKRADTLLRLPAPVGFAAASNRGLCEVDTEFVALVNDDAVVEPGWAERLLRGLASDVRLAAAQGLNRLPSDPPRVDGCGIGWNSEWQAIQIAHGVATNGPAEPTAPREIFGASATAALYRRGALARVATDHGIFDERLESFYEDVDLAVRLRAAGFGATFVPDARALHRGSLTTGRDPYRKALLLTRNRRWVLARLLGRDLASAQAVVARRDRRDLLRALARLDLSRLHGIIGGRRAAGAGIGAFAHSGAPLVSREVLAGFGAPRE